MIRKNKDGEGWWKRMVKKGKGGRGGKRDNRIERNGRKRGNGFEDDEK